jgi:ribonuclease VapC
MMIIDTSAVVSIIKVEAGFERLLSVLSAAPSVRMAAANYVEAGMVLATKADDPAFALAALDRFIQKTGVQIAPLDEAQARVALDARIRFGKGFGHPARLNYGDSFAYALAKISGEPLLFVGEDFSKTDIEPALV